MVLLKSNDGSLNLKARDSRRLCLRREKSTRVEVLQLLRRVSPTQSRSVAGRVCDQCWLVTSSSTALDRIQYGFDRNSNRLFRDNLVASSGQDEYDSYDNLNQLTVLKRGNLNAGRADIAGNPVRQENFTFDPTGNRHGSSSGYVTRPNGVTDLDQHRSNNPVNEITYFTTTTTGTGWAAPRRTLR